MPVKEKAPAKLNLGLRILGKREDGYHDILSIFQTVTLFDELTLISSLESRLICNKNGIPTGRDNLIIKAHEVFKNLLGIPSQATFSLKKAIPVGAGLGGGSSDAAAALRGLVRFHGVESSNSILHECAEQLGSDIPFLLWGGTAIVSGKGERTVVVEWPFDFTYVIVYPGFEISTKWAYENLGEITDDNGVYQAITEKLKDGTLRSDEFFSSLRNDFEPIVLNNYPVLREIKSGLAAYGACALLTGSGSSVFGIFDNEEAAAQCAQSFRKNFSDVFTVKPDI